MPSVTRLRHLTFSPRSPLSWGGGWKAIFSWFLFQSYVAILLWNNDLWRVRMRKTYKFRLLPTKKQTQKLDWTLDMCCILYNSCLVDRKNHYEQTGKGLSRIKQQEIFKFYYIHADNIRKIPLIGYSYDIKGESYLDNYFFLTILKTEVQKMLLLSFYGRFRFHPYGQKQEIHIYPLHNKHTFHHKFGLFVFSFPMPTSQVFYFFQQRDLDFFSSIDNNLLYVVFLLLQDFYLSIFYLFSFYLLNLFAVCNQYNNFSLFLFCLFEYFLITS